MRRQFLWLFGTVGLVASFTLVFLAIKPMARVRVLVRSDNGPVAGVPVRVWGLLKWEDGQGITDQSGVADIGFRSFSGIAEIDAFDAGYYRQMSPRVIIQFDRRSSFTWRPWPTNAEIVIRRIGTPVAMYAKDACGRLGVFGQSRAYDLVIGDWVAPYGSGMSNDFIFEIEFEVSPVKTNRTMRLTFSNPGDGIQHYRVPGHGRSTLPIPALAPLSGYRSKWVVGTGSKDGENEILKTSEPYEEVDFYFRIRTKTEPDASVTGGLYGKIYEGIYFDTEPDPKGNRRCSPGVNFTYFLNPDGTRNTEFNQVNLFTNLSALESIRVNRP